MCCSSVKAIESDTKKIPALGGSHKDKLCDTLQEMASNTKTVYQTSTHHIERIVDRLELLSPTQSQRYQQQREQNTLQSGLINKPKFLKATHHHAKNRRTYNTEVDGGGGLMLVKTAREPASSRLQPRASRKKSHKSFPFAVGIQTVVRDQLFPQKAPGSRL